MWILDLMCLKASSSISTVHTTLSRTLKKRVWPLDDQVDTYPCLWPVRFVRGLGHSDDVSSLRQGRSSPQQCHCHCGRSGLAARKQPS